MKRFHVCEGWRGIPGWLSEEEAGYLVGAASRVPHQGLIVEIGTWAGKSAFVLTRHSHSCVRVITIDSYLEDSQAAAQPDALTPQQAYYYARDVGRAMGERLEFCHCDSLTAAREVEGQIDLLFIDGHHSQEQVQKELDAYLPLMAPVGEILFHDYVNAIFRLDVTAIDKLTPPWEFAGTAGSIGCWRRTHDQH